jgi:hypothetical protein
MSSAPNHRLRRVGAALVWGALAASSLVAFLEGIPEQMVLGTEQSSRVAGLVTVLGFAVAFSLS